MQNAQDSKKIEVVAKKRFSVQMPWGFDPVCGDMHAFAEGETVGTLRYPTDAPLGNRRETVLVDTQYGEYRLDQRYLKVAS